MEDYVYCSKLNLFIDCLRHKLGSMQIVKIDHCKWNANGSSLLLMLAPINEFLIRPIKEVCNGRPLVQLLLDFPNSLTMEAKRATESILVTNEKGIHVCIWDFALFFYHLPQIAIWKHNNMFTTRNALFTVSRPTIASVACCRYENTLF